MYDTHTARRCVNNGAVLCPLGVETIQLRVFVYIGITGATVLMPDPGNVQEIKHIIYIYKTNPYSD